MLQDKRKRRCMESTSPKFSRKAVENVRNMTSGQEPKGSWSSCAIHNVVANLLDIFDTALSRFWCWWCGSLCMSSMQYMWSIYWIIFLIWTFALSRKRPFGVPSICIKSRIVPGISDSFFLWNTAVMRMVVPQYSWSISYLPWPSIPSLCAGTSKKNESVAKISFRHGTLASGKRDLKCIRSGRRASVSSIVFWLRLVGTNQSVLQFSSDHFKLGWLYVNALSISFHQCSPQYLHQIGYHLPW
jgi:hypothetical protein